MDRELIVRLAEEAGLEPRLWNHTDAFENFAALVAAAEREKVARWMIDRSYATGHGDTIEDLLTELEWQINEREREACAKVCESEWSSEAERLYGDCLAAAIKARGTE